MGFRSNGVCVVSYDIIKGHRGELKPTEAGTLEHRALDEELDGSGDHPHYVCYVFIGPEHLYIGQTKDFLGRTRGHYGSSEKSDEPFREDAFDRVAVVFGSKINSKEANVGTLDALEANLIACLSEDNAQRPSAKRRKVTNSTDGNRCTNNTRRAVLTSVVKPAWDCFVKLDEGFSKDSDKLIFNPNLDSIRNGFLFKYSIFNELTPEQKKAADEIVAHPDQSFVVEGMAGTGKTVLATNLMASLESNQDHPRGRIAIVCRPNVVDDMRSLVAAYCADAVVDVFTHEAVFKSMDDRYDTIIVDEAHRLPRLFGTNVQFLSKPARMRGVDDALEYLIQQGDQVVLLYDRYQTVRSGDITRAGFESQTAGFKSLSLTHQMRISAGHRPNFDARDYVNGIACFLGISTRSELPFDGALFHDEISDDPYFGICDSVQELFDYLDKEEDFKSDVGPVDRVVAGYCRPWISNKQKVEFDPDTNEFSTTDGSDVIYDWNSSLTGGKPRRWNSTTNGWANGVDKKRDRYRQEIGCIHSVQGADLNYAGVIIGNDVFVGKDGILHGHGKDFRDDGSVRGLGGKANLRGDEFDALVRDAYLTILMRAIDGIRIYFMDTAVRDYFEKMVRVNRPL